MSAITSKMQPRSFTPAGQPAVGDPEQRDGCGPVPTRLVRLQHEPGEHLERYGYEHGRPRIVRVRL